MPGARLDYRVTPRPVESPPKATMLNMFRASQRQLLRATPNLNLKLHHPLPMDARQSEKLLNLLTTSFRKQLDKEHGGPESEVKDSLEEARPHAQPIINSHAPSPDVHMKRLLANPHFRVMNQRSKVIELGDPMIVFEAAVAKGMMTIDSAAHCLKAKKDLILQSTIVNIQDGMRESGAGTVVLKWLISSGHANSLDFLRHRAFSTIFMQFLVQEGLEEACWTWIRKSLKDVPKIFELPPRSDEREKLCSDIIAPLDSFIHGASARTASLDNSFSAVIKAAGYLPKLSLPQAREVFGGILCKLAGRTKNTSWNRAPPTESIFDAFLRLMPASRKTFEYDLAHLRLLHPTRPSADHALELLREIRRYGPRVLFLRSEDGEMRQAEFEIRVMGVGLAAAKFLLKHGQYAEAQEVMDCLRIHFPVQLGLNPICIERFKADEAEASSLEMLESLDRLSVA